MNRDKAREYFSAYAEGTLEPGLMQTFEQRLKTDAGLQAEYQEFEDTYEQLSGLRFVSDEVPFDLHERIQARLDKQIFEQKRTATPTWTIWIRNLAYASVAATLILGTIVSLNAIRSGQAATSGVINVPAPVANIGQLGAKASDRDVVVTYQTDGKKTVDVKSVETGKIIREIELNKKAWQGKLNNPGSAPAAFEVSIQGDPAKMVVALSGTGSAKLHAGSGTLTDFAKALAAHYRVPVIVKANGFDDMVKWDLKALDAVAAAKDTLDSTTYSVEVHSDNAVWIVSNG